MRLIISAAGINEADHPVVLGLQVLDRDPVQRAVEAPSPPRYPLCHHGDAAMHDQRRRSRPVIQPTRAVPSGAQSNTSWPPGLVGSSRGRRPSMGWEATMA
jgi:hypothetical protein